MTSPRTLTEMLESVRGLDRSITYIEGEQTERRVSFSELHARALGILGHLQKLGARPGDQLILFLGQNEAFIDAFWAAILGGIVPVPVAIGISDEHRRKLLRIAELLTTPFIYSDRKTLDRIGNFVAQNGGAPRWVAVREHACLVDDISDLSSPGAVHRAKPEDTAFIQFSSGSTSDPKGVVLTHANVIANWHGSASAAHFSAQDVAFSWMPLTHDMGLLGMHIYMLGSGCQLYQMPTDVFVRRPLLWLQQATRVGATILCSPNFGYRHYLKVLGDREPSELNLSRVRLLFNGAEPISRTLADEFMARLAPAQLARSSMFPVYGLAEACVAVSFPTPGLPYQSVNFRRDRLTIGTRVAQLPATDPQGISLVAVGRSVPHTEIRLTDDNDSPLGEGHVGHIQIRGDNVTHGYFSNPEANSRLFSADGWLRTGDLGVQLRGELFITGRYKEIIFINGQNYYPHDLEAIALRCPELELGKLVITGLRRADSATDELTAFVLHRGEIAEFAPLANKIARLINEQTGLELTHIVPVKRIPKTTSGKIQRHLLEQELLAGQYDAQMAQLAALRSAAPPASAPSSSEIEARLKQICEAALDGRVIGVNEDFFELGASSLKLIDIHERIDREFPNRLDLTELFDHPTIAALARHLQNKLTGS